MDSDDESLDSTFGQRKAFNLEDPLVDPKVLSYLKGVRTQALRTSAISTRGRSNSPKHGADIYDDGLPSKETPEALLAINLNGSSWMEWFNKVKNVILKEGKTSQDYDEDTLELVLQHLKDYLQNRKGLKGIFVNVLNILKDLEPTLKNEDYNNELEIDPDWVQKMMDKCKVMKVANLDDLKRCITEKHQVSPKGFKEWYHFLQTHEPAHTYFTGQTINGESIWVLVQYMSQDWIKDINKQKNFSRAQRFGAWLLYILFHLPTDITAEYVSNIRELGKRCKRLVTSDIKMVETKKYIYVKDCESSEMEELSTPPPPKELDILKLALVVIASVYRQSDLINWNI